MSTFEYTPGVTTPSTYNNESIIKVMNGGSTQIPANAFFSGGTALITSGSVSLTFESNSNITFINTKAFTGCYGLTNVTLPASLTGIGLDVFQHCDLTTLTIEPGSSLTTGNIASFAFRYNDGMTVNINKATASNINITVPSKSTSFFGAENVTTLNYPNTFFHTDGVTNTSNYNGESLLMINNSSTNKVSANSYNGKMLSSYPPVTIGFEYPSTTKTIEELAFANTPSLKNMTVPNSLIFIASNAFLGSGLEYVTISQNNSLGIKVELGKQVPFYGANVFMSLPAGEILEISTDIIFPYPKNEKNKRLLGVNQKISSGLARPNFKFQTNQFSAGRSRTAQSKQKADGPYTIIFSIR